MGLPEGRNSKLTKKQHTNIHSVRHVHGCVYACLYACSSFKCVWVCVLVNVWMHMGFSACVCQDMSPTISTDTRIDLIC